MIGSDVFIWGGDVVYTDTIAMSIKGVLTGDSNQFMPMSFVKGQYDKSEEYPYYPELKATGTKVIGVWDDHDFGVNDGDKTYPYKHETRDIFLDFVGESKDSPRRLDKNSSLHQDYIVNHGDLKIHIVLLDNRFDFDKEAKDRLGDQ